jgi:hypothetical protein
VEEDAVQPPAVSREERIAYNEDWSRQLNERKAEWLDDGYVAAGFRCECWEPNCTERIRLSGPEWRKVRSRDNRFAVAPGHVSVEIETVVEEHPSFWIVDKKGKAGKLAEELA